MEYKLKYLLKLTLIGLLVSFITACSDDEDDIMEPSADFSAESTELKVTFTSETQYAVSLLWDFGDGETSTKVYPSHTYPADGSYNVTLTATGREGSSPVSVTKTVEVLQINPTADFSYAIDPNDAKTIIFTSNSVRAVSYAWDFGDGSTSTEENPTHTYAASAAYTVTLTTSGQTGSVPATVSKTIPVDVRVFIPVELVNADFSFDSGTKYNNWGSVPGWSSDTPASDSGTENGVAYKMSSDPEVYQLTNLVILDDREFKLNVKMWDGWNTATATAYLYYDTGDGVRNILASKEVTNINGVNSESAINVELITSSTPESLGAKLGVMFTNTPLEGNDGWLNFDDVELYVK